MTQTVKLHRWNRRDIALADALKATFAALGDEGTMVALCSTPREWRFARLQATQGHPHFDWGGLPALSVADIFDLRAFAIAAAAPFELRWRAEGKGSLAAWLTTREGFNAAKLGAAALPTIEVKAKIDSRRLLFGRAVLGGAPPGWVALQEGRIGELRVPHDGAAKALEIRGVELVAEDAAFGNAHVAEELLTLIAVVETGEDG